MQINELLTHLQGVKKQPGENQYKALCPCHDDHEPSLDIKVENEKVLMLCRSCGANGSNVMNALKLPEREMFYEQRTRPSNKPKSVDYFYSDTLKKSRFYIWDNKKQDYNKSFCWWHKNGNNWTKGLPKNENGSSIIPPLYKQSNLTKASDGKTIYIVEGEKDVDTVTDKLNLFAVCSPHGASTSKDMSRKWCKAYNPR